MEAFDSHCHLALISTTREELADVLARARDAGVTRVLDVGIHPRDVAERSELLAPFRDTVFLTAGFYPDYADEATSEDVQAFVDDVAARNKDKRTICAIGEIGLDYYHNSENKTRQCAFFEEIATAANDLALPLIIHTRDAWEDTLAIIRRVLNEAGGIFHCFSGDKDVMRRVLDLGYVISFAGNVTYKKAEALREAATYVPLDAFTLETDAPYLSPVPLRGKRNEPANVIHTASAIAEARGCERETVIAHANENAERVLRLHAV